VIRQLVDPSRAGYLRRNLCWLRDAISDGHEFARKSLCLSNKFKVGPVGPRFTYRGGSPAATDDTLTAPFEGFHPGVLLQSGTLPFRNSLP
jgi:hypothetical protein